MLHGLLGYLLVAEGLDRYISGNALSDATVELSISIVVQVQAIAIV